MRRNLPFAEIQTHTSDGSALSRAAACALGFVLVAFPTVRIGLALYVPGGRTVLAMRLFTGILELMVVCLVAADRNTKWPSLASIPRWIRWSVALWLAWSVPSILLSAAPGLAVIRELEWLIHGLFGIAVWSFLTAHNDWRPRVVQFLVLGFLLYAVMITLLLTHVPDPDTYRWIGGILGFRNVRHFGHFASIALVAAYAPLLAARIEKGQELRTFVVLTVVYGFLVWAGGRGPFCAIFGSLFLLLIFRRLSNIRQILELTGGSLVLGTFLSVPLTPPNPAFGLSRLLVSAYELDHPDAFASGRFELWGKAIRDILQHPVFGLGPDQFRETLHSQSGVYLHPHNGILQAVLEWGITGGMLFCAVLIGVTVLAWRRVDGRSDPPGLVGVWIVLMLLALSLVSGTLYFALPLSNLAVGFALAFSGSNKLPFARIRCHGFDDTSPE